MIYIQAALYAEGPSDYRFLLPLLERLLDDLGREHLPGLPWIPPLIALPGQKGRRDQAIAAAIEQVIEQMERGILVVHADWDRESREARQTCCVPGMELAQSQHPRLMTVACVPVRETEAWMLADAEVLRELMGREPPVFPMDPETERDPKAVLNQLLEQAGYRRARGRGQPIDDFYEFFGANIGLEKLRKLRSFREMQAELVGALLMLKRA